jgi:anti-sigma factor RsiW
MTEVPSNEDDALRFVMGEFSAAERREFEARLAASAELRALVNELEAGLVITATAAPRHRPPAEVWRRIEKAVAKTTPLQPRFLVLWFGWMRNGWAVAVICVAGWLGYAFLAHLHYASALAKVKNQRQEVVEASPAGPPAMPVAAKPPVVTDDGFEQLQTNLKEIGELQATVSQLEMQKLQLSRSLARQGARLGETNRIKFYQLTSTPDGDARAAPLSPGLQTAVLMAMEHELGWTAGEANQITPAVGNIITPTTVTIGGVDFVDFRPGSHGAAGQPQDGSAQPAADNATTAAQAQPQVQQQTQPQASSQIQPQTESPTASAPASEPTIPAFVSGNNLVVALDSTVVPAGSSVTLTALDANQNAAGGTFVLGNNPAVVTIPLSDGSMPLTTTGLGWMVTINSISLNGQPVNLQFFTPTSDP